VVQRKSCSGTFAGEPAQVGRSIHSFVKIQLKACRCASRYNTVAVNAQTSPVLRGGRGIVQQAEVGVFRETPWCRPKCSLHHYSHSSSFPIPTAFSAHSTASLRSQKYSRMNVLIMSSAETAELLLQNFSCRSQGLLRQNVSGKRCLSAGSRILGAAARRLSQMPVCAK
jgi:hypothetical protein